MISPVIEHFRHILDVHGNIITAVTPVNCDVIVRHAVKFYRTFMGPVGSEKETKRNVHVNLPR